MDRATAAQEPTALEPTSSDALASFFEAHSRIFVLTGAGCSTASGIGDYRDEDGAWKRAQPITFKEFTGNEQARRRYWARSVVGFRHISGALPNDSHRALVELERSGKVSLLVTQNVDGLHQKAGSRSVLDLHGAMDEVECLGCRRTSSRAEHQRRLEEANPRFAALGGPAAPDGDADLENVDYASFEVLPCPSCGGLLKPRVVFFGENVPPERVAHAYAALETSDAALVVGSSLMVFSGYRFAHRASKLGLPLAIVNRGRTRADELARLKVAGDVGAALREALSRSLPRA
jgi:NAD-dependent SIR2 family protein deacetylase